MVVGDLDTLSQRAQVVAAVAAAFQPNALASGAGEGFDHIGAGSLAARMVECGLDAFGVRLRLIADGLEASDSLFQGIVTQIGNAGLDGLIESVEPLFGFGDPLVEFGKMLAATLGALLAAIEDAGEDGFQPLGLKQARFQMARDQLVEPVHQEATSYRPALEAASEFIDVSQSRHGLELLATTDWLNCDSGVALEGDAMMAAIASWPGPEGAAERKARIFTRHHVEAAVGHLRDVRAQPTS